MVAPPGTWADTTLRWRPVQPTHASASRIRGGRNSIVLRRGKPMETDGAVPASRLCKNEKAVKNKKMKKLRVGILFGGRSGEHEVSLLSAASVLNAIDKNKYEVVPIGITKEGHWLTAGEATRLLEGKPSAATHLRAGDPEATPGAAVLATGESVVVPPEPQQRSGSIVPFQTDAASGALHHPAADRAINVDVIFPVLHGTFGEDGTIQGLLELADLAYVGAGVLGSAAGMDKDIMKALFRAAGLPIVKHVTLLRSQWETDPKKVQKLVESKLKYPVFVKPANLGSSVGISKAHDRKELGPAIEEAAKFDRKIVIEQGVGGRTQKAREIECSVLGNDKPEASLPGEIVPGKSSTTTPRSIWTKALSFYSGQAHQG